MNKENGMRWNRMVLPGMITIALLSACSKQDSQGSQTASPSDKPVAASPVTLHIALANWLTDDEYASEFVNPLKKSHPEITLESYKYTDMNNLSQQIAAGNIPDLVVSGVDLQAVTALKLDYNMSDLVKKYNFPISQIDPAALNSIRSRSDTGKLIALPYALGFQGLYYNKDIFDKFAIPYPKGGMTWDDAIAIAKKLTRTDNGVQYFGLAGATAKGLAGQLSLPFVDPKTNKAVVNNDGWLKVYQTLKDIYSIPGNEQSTSFGVSAFEKNKNIAMVIANNEVRGMGDLNWGITSIPTFKDKPGISGQFIGVVVSITGSSKNKDQAFAVIQSLFSNEAQLQMVKDGRPSPLPANEYKTNFLKNVPAAGTQNFSDVLSMKFAEPFPPTKFDVNANTLVMNAFKDTITKGVDLNSALRNAETAINQDIIKEGN